MPEHNCDQFQEDLLQIEPTRANWSRLARDAGDCADCRGQVRVLRMLHEAARNPSFGHLDRERMERLRNEVRPSPRRFIPHALITAAAAAVVAAVVILSNTNSSTLVNTIVRTEQSAVPEPTAAELSELVDDEPMGGRLRIMQRRALIDSELVPAEQPTGGKTARRFKRLRSRMRALRSELTSG